MHKSNNLDEEDYEKLKRVMQYICGTRKLALTIEPDDDQKWWVDIWYRVQPDMAMYIGLFIHNIRKQKLNKTIIFKQM